MRIERIDLWHVEAPLPAPFHPAWIPGMAQTGNRFDLVRLTTASGVEGWSAAPAMGREREGLGALLGPYFLGERADDIRSVRQRLREMSYLGWRLGWLEAACWDAMGRAAGRPVWRMLAEAAGADASVEAPTVGLYASTGELRGGEARAEEVQARLAEGFTGVKLRVHAADPAEDEAQIRTVRERVGDGPTLLVDANQGWRVAVIADAPRWDLERATRFCTVAGELGFGWVEEPLPNDDHAAMAALRKRLDGAVAIAGGELNSQGPPDFGTLLARGCLDVYQPDACFTGGIADTWRIVQMVRKAGFKYSPHTWTNGIGFAVNLQLFAAALADGADPGGLLEYPLDPPGWVPEGRDGLLQTPWRHEQGRLRAPDGPGLGFEIDPAALRRHGALFHTATKLRVAVRAVLDRGLSEARALGDTRTARLAARSAELDAQLAGGASAAGLAITD